jgi:hypothetical protein
MYSITYSGFGAASAQTLANAKAVWPKCWSQEIEDCLDKKNINTYSACPAILKLLEENAPAYDNLVKQTPYCPEPQKDLSINLIHGAMIDGGLLVGLVVGKLLFG